MTLFPKLFSAGRIGSLDVPNRVVFAATSSELADHDGFVGVRGRILNSGQVQSCHVDLTGPQMRVPLRELVETQLNRSRGRSRWTRTPRRFRRR